MLLADDFGKPLEAPGNPGKPKETQETLGNQDRKPRAHGHHRECENIQFGLIWRRPLAHLRMKNQCTCANLFSEQVLPPEPFLPFIVWNVKTGWDGMDGVGGWVGVGWVGSGVGMGLDWFCVK